MASLPLVASCAVPAAKAAAASSSLPSIASSSVRNSALRTSSASAQTNKRPRRSVHFEEVDSSSCDSSIEIASPPSPLNGIADWSGVWYAAADLVGFRDEARQHCRALRQSLLATAAAAICVEDEYSSDSSSDSSSSSAVASEPLTLTCSDENSDENDDEESTRGLEARCCLERQRRKYLTNRCIVRAQKQLSGEQLAMLAQRCTSWAATLAAQEGARDYYRAYNKNGKGDSSVAKRSAPSTSSDGECDAESRRVRPRMTLTA
jgi:hypothetical protein